MRRDYESEMFSLFEEKALDGDGQFAIAYALLTLAKEHRELQENLTFGDASDSHRTLGVLEKLAVEVSDIATALGGMADRHE